MKPTRAALRRLAATRGWSPVEVYVDEGVSGAKDSRPALDRRMADARSGKLDVVAEGGEGARAHRRRPAGRPRPRSVGGARVGGPPRRAAVVDPVASVVGRRPAARRLLETSSGSSGSPTGSWSGSRARSA
ncbi:recombinase family protein [Myxococcota bacterium]|nr:recombinase family protein [Myxococcota bacterium]